MSPTSELRFVQPKHPAFFPVLQQKWVHHHIPAGQTEAPYEWRDVPIVEEEK